MSDKKKHISYKQLPSQRDAILMEEEILRYWDEHEIFRRSIEERSDDKPFVFYEGPPTANGRPGVHHAMARTIKDIVCRFQTMLGHSVIRKAGWDTHGLPVEIEVEHKLGLDGKDQIEKYGVAEFNRECRESVFTYLDEWHTFTRKLGYWLDLDDPYITCDNEYIESVWWILKQFWDQDMLFEGHKIVPYCPRCGTSLSSHEVSQGYKDVSDPSIFIKLKLEDEDAFFLVWTTTPWTLISNVALAVGPEHDYVKVEFNGEVLIFAEALLSVLDGEYSILERMKGDKLVGKRYEPCFPWFGDEEGAFRVIGADFVTLTDGTGIVHTAPAFGEDDYKIGLEEGLPFVQPVDSEGKFTDKIDRWAGRFIKDCDAEIIEDLIKRNILYKAEEITHSYPFCWRCDSPLIYYARRSWYIKTTAYKDLLIEANRKISWYPPEVGENRFAKWLEGNVDWALSRERYWGTPLNIWTCDSCQEKFCIGDLSELRSISEQFPDDYDLHKPFIDDLDVGCPDCGGKMTRVPEVIDCWFDSGAMPFAQYHYPMENMDSLKNQYPAAFISEGVDQSRGWFYSLLAIGAFLTKESPYQRCLPHGMILDKNGQKMSKSKGNAVFASDILGSDGADSLRWYLMTSGAPYLPKRFDLDAMRDGANKFLGTLRNLYNFFAMYADIDGFRPTGDITSDNMIDRWLLSRYNTVVREVTASLEGYEMTRAARTIQTFVIDELSNWYLRRCRRRFWKNEMSGDKLAAYEIFFKVLEGTVSLAAPFIPFLSEAVYHRLHGIDGSEEKGGSIHLSHFPKFDEAMIDEKLEKDMDEVRKAVTIGRAVRNKAGIKVRTPLSRILLHSSSKGALGWLDDEGLVSLLLDELNVKAVESVASTDDFIRSSVKPDYSILGKRFGKNMKAAANVIGNLSRESISELVEKEKVSVEIDEKKEVISLDEVQVHQDTEEGFSAESEGGLTIILDIKMTPELIKEGIARDLVNRIQNLRKDSGFDVSDRIELSYDAPDEIAEVFDLYGDHISSETLAERISRGKQEWDSRAEIDLEKHKIELWVKLV
ncbi:MAG: isoleucine--tRNA ligase [Candidatus Krumholzibacteriota bacterium]|nr:isoleucine--tRNA ligase [Candidatus Krumholzibacteriota bacterium]